MNLANAKPDCIREVSYNYLCRAFLVSGPLNFVAVNRLKLHVGNLYFKRFLYFYYSLVMIDRCRVILGLQRKRQKINKTWPVSQIPQ
jgi:hypothetical protein